MKPPLAAFDAPSNALSAHVIAQIENAVWSSRCREICVSEGFCPFNPRFWRTFHHNFATPAASPLQLASKDAPSHARSGSVTSQREPLNASRRRGQTCLPARPPILGPRAQITKVAVTPPPCIFRHCPAPQSMRLETLYTSMKPHQNACAQLRNGAGKTLFGRFENATFEGAKLLVFIRVETQPGAYYLQLCTRTRACRWSIVASANCSASRRYRSKYVRKNAEI